jgi:alanine racemase
VLDGCVLRRHKHPMSAPKQKLPSERPAAPLLTCGPAASEAGGILTIDLEAIAANWRLLAQRVSPAECAAVVKADAYGCGLEPVTRTLADAGCHTFFVALLSEARRVRLLAPELVIYVLNGIVPGSASAFAEIDARPVIGSLPELEEWDAFVAASGWRGGAALHVDTGMNRLGLPMQAAGVVAQHRASSHDPFKLLISHFACAEQADHLLNKQQIDRFAEINRLFPGVPCSLANSSAIFMSRDTHRDLVRPGVALYGGNPTPGRKNPMQSVVHLQARILQIREVPPGDSVGYGASWTAGRPTRVAIIGAGYGDGYLRAVDVPTAREVVVAGRRCPLVGRVSMDLFAVDVTDIPEGEVRRGDFATLIGDGLDIDEVARQAGTISYEVLTSLGRRYARRYSSE